MSKYVASPRLNALLLIGGDDARKQQKSLSAGIDIVVGTPGKVSEMVTKGSLDLSRIRFFVLDEVVANIICICSNHLYVYTLDTYAYDTHIALYVS